MSALLRTVRRIGRCLEGSRPAPRRAIAGWHREPSRCWPRWRGDGGPYRLAGVGTRVGGGRATLARSDDADGSRLDRRGPRRCWADPLRRRFLRHAGAPRRHAAPQRAPTRPSGFPLGTFTEGDSRTPIWGACGSSGISEPDGRYAEIQLALDGQPHLAPPSAVATRSTGRHVTIATTGRPTGGRATHAWRIDGDVLWTVFLESDIPDDEDWFEALDTSALDAVPDDDRTAGCSSSTTTPVSGRPRVGRSRRRGGSWSGRRPMARPRLLAVASLRPDVVLLDIGLPDIDGFAVAERLAAATVPPTWSWCRAATRGAYARSDRDERGARVHRQGRSRPRIGLQARPCLAGGADGRSPVGRRTRTVRAHWRSAPLRLRSLRDLAAHVDRAPRSAALLLADLAVGWSMIAAGLVICDRRPGNRIGPLAVADRFRLVRRRLRVLGHRRSWRTSPRSSTAGSIRCSRSSSWPTRPGGSFDAIDRLLAIGFVAVQGALDGRPRHRRGARSPGGTARHASAPSIRASPRSEALGHPRPARDGGADRC